MSLKLFEQGYSLQKKKYIYIFSQRFIKLIAQQDLFKQILKTTLNVDFSFSLNL